MYVYFNVPLSPLDSPRKQPSNALRFKDLALHDLFNCFEDVDLVLASNVYLCNVYIILVPCVYGTSTMCHEYLYIFYPTCP